MHDRYADDVGQFLKVALMRWLISPSPYGRTHRLGVIWLQELGGHHRLDGDHLAYLHATHDAAEDLRSIDPDLYDQLRLTAAQSGRPVSARETWRTLPTATLRFDRSLRIDELARQDRATRVVSRQRWFHEAMVAVSPCSLVFIDFDDGVAGDGAHRSSSDHDDSVSMSEVRRLLERGQSVVTHQLADASQPLPDLAKERLSHVHDAVGGGTVGVGSNLQDRIGALQLSRWGDEFRVYPWRSALLTA